MLTKLNKIKKLLNSDLISSDGFTIPELLEIGTNEAEDRIFAIINYKPNYWNKLIKLMFENETIRTADSKIQFGFVVKKND